MRPDAGGAWSITTQWESGSAALTLAAISCVLYSVAASPFNSLTLLLRTLVLLSLFSFVVKFGLMVQISDLWQFLLFLFPLLTTMQLLKLQMPKLAGLWGQLIVFMGSFISVTNPPVYDYADFLNDNLAKIPGVGLAWLAFAVLRPGSDARKSRRHIRELRRGLSISSAVNRICVKVSMNPRCTTMSASSITARLAFPPLAAALGSGPAELFPRGLATSRMGDTLRSAVAGARRVHLSATRCDE